MPFAFRGVKRSSEDDWCGDPGRPDAEAQARYRQLKRALEERGKLERLR